MNPTKLEDRERLSKAMSYWHRQLEPFRRNRRHLIEDYAGADYGKRSTFSSSSPVYVNLMLQTAEAYSIALAYNAPRFLLTAANNTQQGFAKRFEIALNNYSLHTHLEIPIRQIIQDAFFSIGIAKVLLGDSHQVMEDLDPYGMPGMPLVSRVSLDNHVHDGAASEFRKCGFIGDRYRMPLELAKQDPRFDKKARKALEPIRGYEATDGEESVSTLAFDPAGQEGEYQEMVELVDIFLRRENLIVTFEVDGKFNIRDTGKKPLAIQEWDGTETGPYRFLSFGEVPDNCMPTSPARNVRGLFVLYNNLLRKLAMRARKQKDIPVYEAGAEQDMKRLLGAEDLEAVQVNSKESIDVLKLGGVDHTITAFSQQILELFKQSAGNLDAMAGLGPQSGTATQDSLIHQQVGRREASAKRQVTKFVSEIGMDVAELIFEDPVLVIPGSRQIPNTEIEVDASWYPEDLLPRIGNFLDYAIQVDPYSMEYRSPAERLGAFRETLQQGILPLMDIITQQGGQFNIQKYLEIEAELQDMPRLSDLFTFQGPPPEGTDPGKNLTKSAGGPKEYIRKNVSMGGNSNSRMQTATQEMGRGNNSQPGQLASSGND